MELLTHFGQDPKKVLVLGINCGFGAYRLLNIEYDPITADTEFGSLKRVLMVGMFACKSLIEERVLLRQRLAPRTPACRKQRA